MLQMARLTTWYSLTAPCGVVGTGKTKTCATKGGYSMCFLIIILAIECFHAEPYELDDENTINRNLRKKPKSIRPWVRIHSRRVTG
jgi:hypothetical protein